MPLTLLRDEYEEIAVDLVFRAVGYRGVRVAGVPFEPRTGTVPNQKGRVMDPEMGDVIAGEYVVGWAKRGPSGIIGTNRKDATENIQCFRLKPSIKCSPMCPI